MANKHDLQTVEGLTAAMAETMALYDNSGLTIPWDASTVIKDMAYQAGGLVNLDMKLNGERHSKGKTKEQLLEEIEEELAEVIGLSLYAAKKLNLNIIRGFEKMLTHDQEKVSAWSGQK